MLSRTHWSHSADLPEPCSPPFNAHHPDEEISVWDSTQLFTEFCTEFVYWELAEERYLWLIKSPTTPIHPPQQQIHRKTRNPSTQELPQTSMYVSTKSYSALNYCTTTQDTCISQQQQQQQQALYTTLVYSKFPAKNLHSVAANCLSLSLSSHIYTRIYSSIKTANSLKIVQ